MIFTSITNGTNGKRIVRNLVNGHEQTYDTGSLAQRQAAEGAIFANNGTLIDTLVAGGFIGLKDTADLPALQRGYAASQE